jgi:signal transduction histidine kinase
MEVSGHFVGGKDGFYENEYRVIGITDGKTRWIRTKGKIRFDENGKAIRLTGVVQDITQQKHAEQALRESEERYQHFIHQSSEGIWRIEITQPIAIDLPPHEQIDLFFEHAYFAEGNRAMAAMYGFTDVSELVGAKLNAFFPRDKDTEQYLERFIASGYKLNDTESKEFDQVGNIKYFLNNLVGVVYDGKVVRAWGTQRDITTQKAAQEVLKQSQDKLELLVAERTRDLQRSNEDLEQFAHVASHDLKEPSRKMLTYSMILRDELGSGLSAKIEKSLSKLVSSAVRMHAMIDGVLLYSSMQNFDQTAKPINLDEVLQNIESDLEILFREKKGTIRYTDLPTVPGSPVLIYQLFYNLVSNSLKFTRKGVAPAISIKQVPVSIERILANGLDATKNYVAVRVGDNGIGFDNTYAAQIFRAFIRLHSKDKFEGTGLGLSLCQKIADRHHGTIYAEGKPNEGAAFTVVLPL